MNLISMSIHDVEGLEEKKSHKLGMGMDLETKTHVKNYIIKTKDTTFELTLFSRDEKKLEVIK